MSENKLSRIDILDRARIVDLDKGFVVISAAPYYSNQDQISDKPHGHGIFPLDAYKDTKSELSELFKLIEELSDKNVRFISNRKTSGYKEQLFETHLKVLISTVKDEYLILYSPEQHIENYEPNTINRINNYIDELSKNNAVLLISCKQYFTRKNGLTREAYREAGVINMHGYYEEDE